MGKESTSQAEYCRRYMSEERRCQLKALLDEKWGKLEAARPKLKLIQGGKGARHE